jgi:hypothetical protein
MTQRGDVDELSAQARAARVCRMFYVGGGEFTVHEVAQAVGVEYGGAWRLLRNISREIPIVEPEQRNGKWRLMA